jgi:methionyl-tRNA formyltransferase
MGTPEFSLPTLETLAEQYTVVGVVTQPDRRAGRGRHLSPPPVKEMAEAEGIEVFQPKRLRGNIEAIEHIRAWSPDVIVVAAYGQIIPPDVLEIPPHGCVNIHPSLLPRWRGATPIQGAILAGDETTGVTIMLMDEGLDTGPILAQRETPIHAGETAGELEDRLSEVSAELLLDILPDYLAGKIAPRAQAEDEVTMTRRLRKSQAEIDWSRSALEMERHIRAYAPDPGAYTTWDGQRFKIFKAQVVSAKVESPDAAAGEVFIWQETPAVMTGKGALALLQVQLAGKRPMNGEQFVRGRRDFLGAILD